jgi:hypothetical protein
MKQRRKKEREKKLLSQLPNNSHQSFAQVELASWLVTEVSVPLLKQSQLLDPKSLKKKVKRRKGSES